MGRRRRKKSYLGDVIIFFAMFYAAIIYVTFKTLTFFISMIAFYSSGYKGKSGNGFFRTYFNKGVNGEYKLYRKVKKVFGKEYILTNIYLPSKSIDNTEIDVLAVKNGRIYCFEMKNYAGYIYGDGDGTYWTQVLRYKTKNKFYNPFRQNYAHKKALEEYLGVDENTIIPIVVFSNRANLQNVKKVNGNIYLLKNLKFDFRFDTYNDTEIANRDMSIIDKLKVRTLMDDKIKQEHIEQVHMLKE